MPLRFVKRAETEVVDEFVQGLLDGVAVLLLPLLQVEGLPPRVRPRGALDEDLGLDRGRQVGILLLHPRIRKVNRRLDRGRISHLCVAPDVRLRLRRVDRGLRSHRKNVRRVGRLLRRVVGLVLPLNVVVVRLTHPLLLDAHQILEYVLPDQVFTGGGHRLFYFLRRLLRPATLRRFIGGPLQLLLFEEAHLLAFGRQFAGVVPAVFD